MARYGDSIYGTRGGPIAPADWGVTTQKEDKVYVHVLHWNGKLLALPAIRTSVRSAHVFPDGAPVAFSQGGDGIVLTIPENIPAK